MLYQLCTFGLWIFFFFSFFFNDTATTEIYTLSLHDALPISRNRSPCIDTGSRGSTTRSSPPATPRSEEHTSELQSHLNLVCRLLLEKKKRWKQRLIQVAQKDMHTPERLRSPMPKTFSPPLSRSGDSIIRDPAASKAGQYPTICRPLPLRRQP